MKKDTMFRMASNTKQVVATGIAILAEDGRLGYDDFARDHLASFDNYRSGDIRIHHLLTHTSGFRIEPVFFKPLLEKSAAHPDAPNLQIEVARFGEFGATEPVGTSYEYSNPGYNTLGAIIEVASGQPLEAFLKQRIYEPLGMTDSYHLETREVLGDKLDRMSVVYKREEEDWVEHWKPGDPPQYPFVRASGGMISTALDFARFCQMFLNEGIYDGKRILTEDAVQTMMLPRAETGATVDGRPVPGDHYGYGWHVSGEGVLWHTGADGTVAWVDPDNELIVLFLGQSDKTRPLAWRFFRLVELAINH